MQLTNFIPATAALARTVPTFPAGLAAPKRSRTTTQPTRATATPAATPLWRAPKSGRGEAALMLVVALATGAALAEALGLMSRLAPPWTGFFNWVERLLS